MTALHLDAEAVARLLPHRPPLLLVDTVESYERAPRPTLHAARRIAPDEPIFAGHFPGHPIWPGAYTIEGLAQSCLLLGTLTAIEQALGAAPTSLAEALRAAPAVFSPKLPALLVDVNVRLLDPVLPGCRLDYLVAESARQASDTLLRYDVEARVAARPVARGTLIVSRPRS